MLLNIERIKNKIFNDDDCMEEITLNNDNENDKKTLKNILLITKYNSRLHLISYLYLKQLNQILLLFFICASFITGLVEIVKKDNINLRAFLSSGSLWDSDYASDNEFYLRQSIGLSFDILTAVGPVSFSYAVPLRKKSYDNTREFNFSIGTSF